MLKSRLGCRRAALGLYLWALITSGTAAAQTRPDPAFLDIINNDLFPFAAGSERHVAHLVVGLPRESTLWHGRDGSGAARMGGDDLDRDAIRPRGAGADADDLRRGDDARPCRGDRANGPARQRSPPVQTRAVSLGQLHFQNRAFLHRRDAGRPDLAARRLQRLLSGHAGG